MLLNTRVRRAGFSIPMSPQAMRREIEGHRHHGRRVIDQPGDDRAQGCRSGDYETREMNRGIEES